MDQKWQEIKREIKKGLSKGQYDLWISTLDFLGIEDACLLLGCRNRFHIDWVREKLEEKLVLVVRYHFPQVQAVEYRIVSPDNSDAVDGEVESPHQRSFRDLVRRPRSAFNPRFTFDQFVVGDCNHLAYAAAMGMASGQQYLNQSVYLLSDTGLGKSHLSHAVGNYLSVNKPDLRVQYSTTEQFANEMIFSLKQGSIEAFKNKFRVDCDVLLLERIEFLSGKERVQNELVYTLDELMDRGKKVLCTGNAFPRDIPKLNNELQSRLGGVLVAPIENPDFSTRIEIIRSKSQRDNIQLPLEVMEFLADRITGDVRQLESCIVGIIAKTHILGVPPTLDLVQEVTQTMLDRLPKITVDHIQKLVCSCFQISVEDLRSNSRRKEIAMARKIGIYLCRQFTTESLESIGKSFKRSHSSTLYAVNGITKEMEDKNSKLKQKVDYVTRRLETSCLSV